MPIHPPTTGDVYQPRFMKKEAVPSLTLWYQAINARPIETNIVTSPQVNWTGIEPRYLCQVVDDDFCKKAAAALTLPLTYAEVSASTNAAGDFDANASGGTYSLTHSADSEAQTMRIDCADQLLLNVSRPWYFETRLKINFAGAAFSADQRFVAGVCSAYNATLDSTTHNAWFRVEGATLDIYAESDDNTTNTDDVDTTVNIVDNTYIVLRIEGTAAGALVYMIDGVVVTSTACTLAAAPANTVCQPIIAIQRDAGTEQEVVTIDYVRCGFLRA